MEEARIEEELVEGSMVTPSLRLVSRLGGGGMGSVWIAEHLALETRVAVKLIATGLASNAASVPRFRGEAAAAAQVKSPHVAQVLDYGVTARGTPFIVMELLEGRDLRARILAGAPLPPRETVAIVRQVARALTRAHELGIIHRDIKPENVFLCHVDDEEPFVKVLDFGIAKRESGPELTTTGTTVGTPYYMSPEQLIGSKAIDARSDLWSLAVMTFYMLTGRRPFTGETAAAIAVAIHSRRMPLPTELNPRLPSAIDAWFARACAREPSSRYPTAKELVAALAVALECTAPGPFDAVPMAPAITARDPFVDSGSEATVPASMRGMTATVRQAPVVAAIRPSGVEVQSSAAVSSSTGATAPTVRTRAPAIAWAIGLAVVVMLSAAALITQLAKSGPSAASSPASTSSASVTATEPIATAEPTPQASTSASIETSAPVASSIALATKPKEAIPIAQPRASIAPKNSSIAATGAKSSPPPAHDEIPELK